MLGERRIQPRYAVGDGYLIAFDIQDEHSGATAIQADALTDGERRQIIVLSANKD
ncbi:MAG: hypothetical protein ACLQF1_18980 [Methyloceanibacter sp.]|jgi:hypothetical protein